MGFSIKTEQFEGPLDILIDLIEKRKLLVNDIAIAQVTDEYLTFVAELETYSMRDVSQFIGLASTLLLIKSRSLLPVLEVTVEEEEAMDDLEARLKRYQMYRNAGTVIQKRFNTQRVFRRPFIAEREPLFVPDVQCTKETLYDRLRHVLAELPQRVVLPEVRVRKTVSLGEMMDQLRQRMMRQMRIGFFDFAGGRDAAPATKIVSFLAVLELVRQGSLDVSQKEHFADIEISREGIIETPRFS